MAIIDKNGYLHGKVGDDVYYVLNGRQVKRKVCAPRKGPKTEGMKISEKHAAEFGKASSAGKNLRSALAKECERLEDRHLYQRVNALMTKLKNCDASPVGSRTAGAALRTDDGRKLLDHFTFHRHLKKFPRLLSAAIQEAHIEIMIEPYRKTGIMVTVLQINLISGDFRRYETEMPSQGGGKPFVMRKEFRAKKGFTELAFISGPDFLQGVVIRTL